MKNWMKTALGNERSDKRMRELELSVKSQNEQPLIALQLAHRAHWGDHSFEGLSEAGYQTNAIAYRCVRLIAESAASVGFNVTRNGESEGNDPLFRAFEHAHIETAFTEVLEQFYGYLQVSGNGYLEAIKVDERIIGFRALRPDRVEIKTGTNGYKLGCAYRINNRTRLIKDDLANGQCGVYHMRLFHPSDDHYGYAPMAAAARAVDMHNEGARWAKALLDNSARPSGALIYKGMSGTEQLSRDQFDRLKVELEQAHSGANRAGRPMLLGDNTYSNYREANLAFWRMIILPLVKKTALGLQRWLRPYYGPDVKITVDMDTISALSEERTALWNRLSQADFLTNEERRSLAGLPPLEVRNER